MEIMSVRESPQWMGNIMFHYEYNFIPSKWKNEK